MSSPSEEEREAQPQGVLHGSISGAAFFPRTLQGEFPGCISPALLRVGNPSSGKGTRTGKVAAAGIHGSVRRQEGPILLDACGNGGGHQVLQLGTTKNCRPPA